MASTYVNNLRLNEMATGDGSGTWGTTTNTNLELIGEALGFGTEAITTNADTHTTTVADGSSDAGRAMYLKYTGTLDSACTITIGPNTMKRMQFIENGTSGSQNIIISQGSGANITIPPGDVKAVYLDGAGSGAAVVDAFASLNVVDLKVQDDLTVTDDAAIGGLATVGGTLGVTGVVTANAGVAIDNITIDGTEIDLSSGDLTLDVAGDIILDADGGDVILKDGGTTFGQLTNDSGQIIMYNAGSQMLKGASGSNAQFVGTVGIGVADPTTYNASDKLALYSTGNTSMVIAAGTSSESAIFMADGTSGAASYDGYLQYSHSDREMRIGAEAVTKILCDSAVTLYYNNGSKFSTNNTGTTTNGLHTATQSANITQVAITSSSNAVAWDARAAANAYHVTTENTTFSAPSNAVEGAIISVEIAQGGTARTIAWNTVFEFAASTAPTITATANKTDILSFRYNGSVWQEIGRVQNLAQT